MQTIAPSLLGDGLSLEQQTASLGKILLAQFQSSQSYKNPNTNGSIKEDFLRTGLRARIPEIIGIGKGEIYDAFNAKTGEYDLVLYDKFYSPLLESFGSNQLFFVETVAGIVEVKSDCNPTAIQDAITKTQTLSKLRRNYSPTGISNYFNSFVGGGGLKNMTVAARAAQSQVGPIFSGMIAFSGAINSSTIIGNLGNSQDLDFVCVIEQNHFLIRNRTSGAWAAMPTKHNSLYWLIVILLQYLNEFRNRVVLADIDLTKYP